MGIFSSIKKVATTAVSTIKTAVTQPVASFKMGAAAVTSVLANPVTAVTQGYNAAYQKALSSTPTQNIVKGSTTAALAAGAVIGGAAAASAGVAATAARVATAVIPTTTKGKVIAAVAAPVVIGAVSKTPAKAAEAVIETPAALVNVGQNIGELVKDPSIKNVKELVTDNPVIVGTAAAVGVIAAGKALIPAIATTRQTEAIQEQTKAIQAATNAIPSSSSNIATSTPVVAAAPGVDQVPKTAETERIATAVGGGVTSSTRRKRRSSKPVMQNFKQNVNVIVQNKANSRGLTLNKRYIYERAYN